MKQNEHSVVREAQRHAQHDLRHEGRIRPAVFMLVGRNPQTGAPMAQPAAIGTVLEGPEAGSDHEAWLDDIRIEAARLQASAIALCLEAEAEVEGGPPLRVALVHVEDGEGLEVLHAPIERARIGVQLGAFLVMTGPEARAAVGIDPPLLEHRTV